MPCRSVIGKGRDKVAIRGDAVQTRPVFLAFLDWLEPQLPRSFARAAEAARSMLLRADRQGTGFHLELREVYPNLEPDEVEDEAFVHAADAEALFEEVRSLVMTEGTTLGGCPNWRIAGLAEHWKSWLGLDFQGIVDVHLGGELGPDVGRVEVPPIPAPRRARRRGVA